MKKFSLIAENLINDFTINEKYREILEDILSKIESTIESSTLDLVKELMRSYIADSETTIIGLINDSDIFDFYLLHRNAIDEILAEDDFFKESPDELGVMPSVYDYVIFSTKRSIQLIFGYALGV